jgi:hypothetical protein
MTPAVTRGCLRLAASGTELGSANPAALRLLTTSHGVASPSCANASHSPREPREPSGALVWTLLIHPANVERHQGGGGAGPSSG